MKTKQSYSISAVCATWLILGSAIIPSAAAPEIEVIRAQRSLTDGHHTLGFGEVAKGSESAAVTFTIRNAGTSRLTSLKVVVRGTNPKDFSVIQPAKLSLAPGGKTSFKVRFAPLQIGLRKAQLRIVSNDADENPFRIAVKGTGVSSQPLNWAGQWQTDWGMMTLTQTGSSVVGTYAHDSGRITATVEGDTLVGTWSESPSYAPPSDAGDFVFTISADRKSFSGVWRYGSEGEMSSGWTGTRVE